MGRRFDVETRITGKNVSKKAFGEVDNSLVRMQKNMMKVNAIGKNMVKTGGQMKSMGRSAVFAGVAVGGAMAFMVKSAVDFEKKMGRISTLLDDDVAGVMDKYSKQIKKIAVATGGSLGGLQDAFFEAKSGGVALGEVLDFITLAQKGAVGGFTDATTVTKALTKVMNAYKLDVKGATKVLDQFFIANDVGQTTIGELGRSIGTVAGSMALFGASTGEMISAVAIGTKVLPSTEEVVTSLNGLLTSIKKPTEDATAEIERLNKTLASGSKLDFSIGGFKKRGLLGFFKNVMKATKGNVTSLNELFGANVRGFKVLATLVQQEKEFIKTTERMEAVTNDGALAQSNFNKQTATMAFKMDVIKAKFQIFRVEIGEKLFPVLEEIIPKVSKIITKLTDWVSQNKDLTVSWATTITKGVLLLVGAGGLSWALGTIISLVGRLTIVVGALGEAFMWLAANPVVAGILVVIGFILWAIRLYGKYQKIFNSQVSVNTDLSGGAGDRMELARKLNEKFDKGLISQEDFIAQSKKLSEDWAKGRNKVEDALNPLGGGGVQDKILSEQAKFQKEQLALLKAGESAKAKALKKSGVEQIDLFTEKGKSITTAELLLKSKLANGGAFEKIAQAVAKVSPSPSTVKPNPFKPSVPAPIVQTNFDSVNRRFGVSNDTPDLFNQATKEISLDGLIISPDSIVSKDKTENQFIEGFMRGALGLGEDEGESGQGTSVSIENLNLNNVTSTETMVDELDRMTGATGVNLGN